MKRELDEDRETADPIPGRMARENLGSVPKLRAKGEPKMKGEERQMSGKFRWVLCTCFIAALTVLATRAQTQEVDITGYYSGDGTFKDGDFVRITRSGQVYQYLQRYPVGDWIGVAIRDGNNLSIAWQRSDGVNLGVSVFKIESGEKGPTLVGGWAAYPGGGISKDTLKWSRKLD